jgi:hypothetical protein
MAEILHIAETPSVLFSPPVGLVRLLQWIFMLHHAPMSRTMAQLLQAFRDDGIRG